MNKILTVILCLIIFFIVQIYAGFVGIWDSFGLIFAFLAVILAFGFRFAVPLAFGIYLCAVNVWEWHWFFAILFALPAMTLAFAMLFIRKMKLPTGFSKGFNTSQFDFSTLHKARKPKQNPSENVEDVTVYDETNIVIIEHEKKDDKK